MSKSCIEYLVSNAMVKADAMQVTSDITNCVHQHLKSATSGLGVLLILVAVVPQGQQPSAVLGRKQFTEKLVAAALERPKHEVTYDPGYVGITYPGGDVPENSGVCSDEIIRIYRAVG